MQSPPVRLDLPPPPYVLLGIDGCEEDGHGSARSTLPVVEMPRNGRSVVEYINEATGEHTVYQTFTCIHCNRVVAMHPKRQRPRNYCMKCDALTCDLKFCVEECNPIMQSVDLAVELKGINQPFLLRGPRGEVLFDPKLRDERKPY